MNNKHNLQIETFQVRYCGTNYIVKNIPEEMTDEEMLDAVGVGMGWWISGFSRCGNYAKFNVNYD